MVHPALLKLHSLATELAGIGKINRANIANFGHVSCCIFQNLSESNLTPCSFHYLSCNHPVWCLKLNNYQVWQADYLLKFWSYCLTMMMAFLFSVDWQ